jgi:hypothetical protein
MSSSLRACRDTTCTEPPIEACITCTCTNFGQQNMGRKSNVCAHNNWGVPIKVLTSLNNAPWCAVRKSLLYPPIELHGHHRGRAWREIKCMPLVTDFMGKSVCVYGKLIIYYSSYFTCSFLALLLCVSLGRFFGELRHQPRWLRC